MSCLPRLRAIRFPCRSLRYASRKALNAWSDEKLVPIKKYPLSVALATPPKDYAKHMLYGGQAPAAKGKKYWGPGDEIHSHGKQLYIRTQIVSPDACDDIIDYIGHTLEQHKGCDILDLNPGVGLWSQKVHEFLQPRSHVLLEPSQVYDPYLKPLVERPGSTYKFYRGDPSRLETYTSMVESGVFPHQKRVTTQDAGSAKLNTSLLVIGSLIWDPHLSGFGFTSMMRQMVMKFIQSAWHCGGFHSFGPVRSLLWGTQDEMRALNPKGIVSCGRYSFLAQAHTDITEWATTSSVASIGKPKQRSRRPQYEIESTVQALRRGKQLGMELPKHRRDNIHEFAYEIAKSTNGTGKISSADLRQYLKAKEFAGISTVGLSNPAEIAFWEVEQKFEENPTMFIPKGQKGRPRPTAAGQKHTVHRATVKRTGLVLTEIEHAAILGEEVHGLECEILDLPDGPAKDGKYAELKKKEEEFEAAVESININHRSSIISEIDDRLSLHSPAPPFQWEIRPLEPLTLQANEVWPANLVSLVDIVPRPLSSDRDPEWMEWLIDFCVALFREPTMSVREAMEHVQPGASALIDQVPSLKDPEKGGRLNMDQLRVRMLTREMVEGLCRAYMDWPFKLVEANHRKYFQLRSAKRMDRDFLPSE